MKISKEVKTGAVVVVAIALFVYGFNFLQGKDIFKNKFELYAIYNKAEGVIEANPVMINGYKIGTVNKIGLIQKNGEYKVLIKFLLSEKVDIPKGSHAKIVSSDLLGSKAIEIQFNNSTNYVADGDTLIADYEDDLKTAVDKRIAPLQKKAENLISSIDSVMQVVQEVLNANVRQSLVASFESIKTTISYLQHTASNLDTLTTTQRSKVAIILDKVQSITTNIEKSNDKLTNVITNFSNISDSMAKANLKSTIEHANIALTQAADVLTQVNNGKGSMGKLLKNDSLYNNLNHASEDLDKLLTDLRESPERYVHISVFGRKNRKKSKK